MESKILHYSSWAHSVENKPIQLCISHKGFDEAKGKIQEGPDLDFLFIGGVHGDEPEGVRLANDFLLWLKENNSLCKRSWALIPDINPDGSFAKSRTNKNGVDLNRNFPCPNWKAAGENSRYYSGPKPFSEPETCVIRDTIEKLKPRIIFHFHSWEPCIVLTADEQQADAISISKILSQTSGYPFKNDIGYPSPGSLGEWGWHSLGTPVICLEAQEKSDLSTVWPIFRSGLEKIMQDSNIQGSK